MALAWLVPLQCVIRSKIDSDQSWAVKPGLPFGCECLLSIYHYLNRFGAAFQFNWSLSGHTIRSWIIMSCGGSGWYDKMCRIIYSLKHKWVPVVELAGGWRGHWVGGKENESILNIISGGILINLEDILWSASGEEWLKIHSFHPFLIVIFILPTSTTNSVVVNRLILWVWVAEYCYFFLYEHSIRVFLILSQTKNLIGGLQYGRKGYQCRSKKGRKLWWKDEGI